MTEEIEIASKRLMAAVTLALNPLINHQQRAEAYQHCESFKETSPLCAQCGLYISQKCNPPAVRHFGFQLLEHCITLRWNSMSPEEKLFIKNNAMELLASGTKPILEEERHIKSALVKIVVEMIKREWPQHWATLLDELNTLCAMGETQKELVLMIFSMLAEDVAVLQNMQQQRRREVLKTLTFHLPEIWVFFLNTLAEHYQKYKDGAIITQLAATNEKYLIHERIVETLLETLFSGYLEWISFSYIQSENYLLLRMLCFLLSDEKLQQHAAECLLLLVSRKGKPEDRKPFMILFSPDAMEAIFKSAKISASKPLVGTNYDFLKKLCQVLTGLGNQLCALWGVVDSVECPETFDIFLQAALAFTEHNSQLLSSFTAPLWVAFFQHKIISKNSKFLVVLPTLLKTCGGKLAKIGYPSRNDSLSCDYSKLDFDNDEAFTQFFNKFRTDFGDLIRFITLLDPILCFNFGSKWLRDMMVKPIDLGSGSENGICSIYSSTAIEWEALALYLECVHSKLPQAVDPKPDPNEGLALLKTVIYIETQDPVILSSALSCVSALFSYVNLDPDFIPVILKKVFSAVVYTLPGETRRFRNKAVQNLRRHACSALVKICSKQQSSLFLPMFDQIYEHVKKLGDGLDQLSSMEKCTLYEMIVMINNDFNNYERQMKFLEQVVSPVKEEWRSLFVRFGSVQSFIQEIGLNREPTVEYQPDDPCTSCRAKIVFCLSFFLSLLKRSKWPDNPEEASKGGFILSRNDDGSVNYRNPITPSLCPILESLFLLVGMLNSLWVPEIKTIFHPSHGDILELKEAEQKVILGIPGPVAEFKLKTNLERMQNFIATLFENCYMILGTAGTSLAAEFYQFPNLSGIISKSVFINLEYVSDFRLRTMIRVFWKPFTQNCPSYLEETVVLPVLEKFCPFMYHKLDLRWETFRQRYSNCESYEDEMTENQEILEDQISRLLTREYIEMLIAILFNKKGASTSNPDLMDEDNDHVKPPPAETLSNLGVKLLRNEKICWAIALTAFNGLHWLDSQSALKSGQICWPVLKQIESKEIKSIPILRIVEGDEMFTDNSLKSEEEVRFVFQCVMRGLFHLGQHNANSAMLNHLGLQVFELLRPNFPILSTILMEVTGCQAQDVLVLEEKILDPQKKLPEKKRKEIFKNFVACVKGKNIGEMFKSDIQIKNLEPCEFFLRRKKTIDITDSDIGLCSLFS